MTTLYHFRVRITLFAFLIASFLVFMNSCEVADDLLGNETVAEIEGDWAVDETSEIFKSTLENYTVTISRDADNINGVIIDNFYNVNISVKASISGNSLIITSQDAQDGYHVSGSGTISNNREEITLNYVVNDGSAQDDHCTAVWTKL